MNRFRCDLRVDLGGPKHHVLDEVEISTGRAILEVVHPLKKHWESVLRCLTQQKINIGDSGTAATACNAPHWLMSPAKNPPPCNAAFR